MDQPEPFTIVVADDDFDDRELLKDLFLHNERFELIGCLTSGIEVFDEISRKKNIPDILLIDMYMPFFSGIDVVNALQELEAAPAMVKFVISTAINTDEQERHLDNPSVIFLKKPVSIEEMKELPNRILDTMMQRNSLRVY
ncbi:MAG: response regulator [Flavobacterium sp.]|uniref:response regulator n=1 Tax=Flavobacterium sp. TaxID=239 RepID=UPI0032655DD6